MTFSIILAVVAFAAAVASVLGLGMVLHVTNMRRRGFVGYFVAILLFVTAVHVAAVSRDLSAQAEVFISPTMPTIVLWLFRFSSLLLLLAAIERLASFFLETASGQQQSRRVSVVMLVAFVAMWMATTLIPAFLGAVPDFSHQLFYTLLFGCALLTIDHAESVRAIELGRNAVLLYLLASVLVIPFLPLAQTVELNYLGELMPGLPRLHGLSYHAVSLGMLAMYALLCLASHPFKRRWLGIGSWILTLSVLIAAQSKISWAALLICGTAVVVVLWGRRAIAWATSRRNAAILTVLLVGTAIGYFVVSGVLAFGALGSAFHAFLASEQGARLSSLSERDIIWHVAFQEWNRNPVFGYGLTLFDPSYRESIGLLGAVHGHNQVVDTLARAGIVGVTGLALYIVALTYFSFRYAVASRGLTLGLYLLLMLRAITEVPFALFDFAVEIIPHFTLLITIAGLYSRSSAEVPRQSANTRRPRFHAAAKAGALAPGLIR